MAKNKKKNKPINSQRKIELNKIKEWIETQAFDFKTKNQIIGKLEKLSTDNISYIANNLNEFTKDNFDTRIKEIQTEQNNKSLNTGAENMNTETTEKSENNNEELLDFARKNPHIAIDELNEAFELYKKDPIEFQNRFPRQDADNKITEDLNKEETPDKKIAHIGESTATEIHTNENEDKSWQEEVIEEYKQKYNEENINVDALANGIHIEVAPQDEQQLTGTAINYHTEDHIEIQKTQNGIEPKDQSYQHFLDHIEILKNRGFDEIALGETQNPEFRTKLIAAALANDVVISTPLKEAETISLSDKSLKEISPENQTQLLQFALENNVKLEFDENSPLLDFNNEAVQALPDKLKYKYMAILIQNEGAKDKIKNAPKVEFFITNNTKDEEGNDVLNPDGTPKTTNEPNPALNELNEDELSTLRIFNREQQINELKNRVIGQNDDGSNITAGDAHNKVNDLRNRIKSGENRQEVLKDVQAETHGDNFFKYAQKHTQQNR